MVIFMVYYMTMIKVNINEIKTHLSRYLSELSENETILLCKRNEPIAEIRRLSKKKRGKRPIGLAKGRFQVPPEFFEPLPEEIIKEFQGKSK